MQIGAMRLWRKLKSGDYKVIVIIGKTKDGDRKNIWK